MNDLISSDHHPTPHFIVVPLMAQGHMIPMVDLGLLLARRGSLVSLITTPVNALRLRPIADHAAISNLLFRLIDLPFPSKSAGLPAGCENLDLIPSADLVLPFFKTLDLMIDPLKRYINSQPHSPTCIISDQCMPWTMQVSGDLNIPRLVFHGPSSFFLLCTLKLAQHKFYENVTDVREIFTVPDLPQRIEVNRLMAQRFFDRPEMEDVMKQVEEAEDASDGFVLNSFVELESWYIEEYRKSVGKEVWAVGPVSLVHEDDGGMAVRGGGAAAGTDRGGVFEWLDGRETGSVLFISFGSLARTRKKQLVEIGAAMEGSGVGFVWAVKETKEEDDEVSEWLAEFEERNGNRGLVVKGWAPQVMIMKHPAVGGFMTHCGWNSTVEAVAAGVPMVTWPHFADQFLNEKLVVEVLGMGVGVGVKMPSFYQEEMGEAAVGREKVEAAVRRVMGGGEEGGRIRKRAAELGEEGRRAMEEGGSSYESLSEMIKCAVELAGSRVQEARISCPVS